MLNSGPCDGGVRLFPYSPRDLVITYAILSDAILEGGRGVEADDKTMHLPATTATHDCNVGEGAGIAEAEGWTISTNALRNTGPAGYLPGQLVDELLSGTGGRHLAWAMLVDTW